MPAPAAGGIPAAATPVAAPQSAPPAPGQMTWLQAAVAVLADSDVPLTVTEVLDRALAAGLPRPTQARTPSQTLARDLRVAVARGRHGLHSPSRGRYALHPSPATGTSNTSGASEPVAAVGTRCTEPSSPTAGPALGSEASPPSSGGGDHAGGDRAAAGRSGSVRLLVPVEPLATAIEARGGLRACGMRHNPGDPAEFVRDVERLARAYHRARTRGTIGLFDADELAVQALGVHPAVIFGDLWWEPLQAPARRPQAADQLATA